MNLIYLYFYLNNVLIFYFAHFIFKKKSYPSKIYNLVIARTVTKIAILSPGIEPAPVL